MATVVNLKRSGYDVYCGRPGPWGNPYRIGPDGSRAEVVAKHLRKLSWQIETGNISLESLAALNGKRLGCYCAPLPCHAGNLAKAAKAAASALKVIAGFKPENDNPSIMDNARLLAKLATSDTAKKITLEADGNLELRARDNSTAGEKATILSPDGTLTFVTRERDSATTQQTIKPEIKQLQAQLAARAFQGNTKAD